MGRRYLVTGGAGFIGSNFVRWILNHETDATITNLDALTYAGVAATVAELDEYSGHSFVRGDIRDADLMDGIVPGHDFVVHFAAESHVDRSISSPAAFLETNIVGTGVLIDAAYRHGVPRFIHVSTDEVYGSVSDGFASESDPLNPSSPYSSSKAGADLLVRSYGVTYGYDVVITRCTNNYGPYQFPEKVIPLFVTNLLEGKKVPLYGDGRNERDWLHVDDHCSALHLLVDHGKSGEIYNIGANAQLSNLVLTEGILAALGFDDTWIERVPDRLGHDLRYAVDSSKVRLLGWRPQHDFGDRLADTIDWYRKREDLVATVEGSKMKGIILAGGTGSRLDPITRISSKQLQPVYDKPMVYYPLATLLLAGIRNILLISTPSDLPQFRSLLGNGHQWGIDLSYAAQPEPKGIAQALLIGRTFIDDDPVALILGDNIFYGNMRLDEVVQSFSKGAVVFGYPVKDPQRYGVAELDPSDRVVSLVEKPTTPVSNLAVPGLYLYDERAVALTEALIPSERGELEITDLNRAYVDRGELAVVRLGRGIAWLDSGTPESLLQAANFIATIEERQGLKIACLEEIAYRRGYITLDDLVGVTNEMPQSGYRLYLEQLAAEIAPDT